MTGAQVIWTQIGGPAATIVDPTDLNTQITNVIGGNTYSFRISTICLDGTLIYQDVIHTVQAITAANAGPDASYCPGAAATLAGNAPGTGEAGLWTGSGGGVTVNTPTSATSSLTILGGYSGPVTLRWTITNSSTGCSSYDEVVITNRGGITPVSAGTDQTLGHCYSSTESTTLNGSYAGSGIDGQIGTWSIVSGPNVPTIVTPNGANTSVTNLIQGTYVFRWTVVGPCDSGTSTVRVIVPAPTANLTQAVIVGGDQSFCDPTITSTVLSGGVPKYINEDILWVQTGGPALPAGSIVSPTSQVTTVNNLVSPNNYTFSYTINNPATVCSGSANVSVGYNPNPPALAITTPNPISLTCGLNTATINFTEGGSGTTQYQLLSGPSTTGIPSFPTSWINAGPSPLIISGLTGNGTYQVQMRRVTTTGGSCSTPFVGISVVTSDYINAANAGTDQILNCNVTSTFLVGNDPTFGGGVGQGTWSQVSGPSAIVITNPHLPTLGISGLEPNSLYVFRWIISGGPLCPTTQDDVQVYTASSIPTDSNAGPDQTGVCYNSPLYLNATAPLFIFEQGTWTVSPNSAGLAFSDVHSPTAVVTGFLPNTTYTFTWTVTNGCGSAPSSMTATVSNTSGPVLAHAGPDQCLSSGTTAIVLAGNNPTPGTGLWTKLSGPAATISNPSAYNTTVTGLTNGVYKFQWAISGGGCSPALDTVVVTIDPHLQSFNAGADQQICGSSATLTSSLGAEPNPGTGVWTQVSGSAAILTTPTTYTTTVTGMISGVYVFRYTVSNGACIVSSDVTLFVSGPPPSIANGGTTPVGVCGSSSVTMNAVQPTSGTGLWTVVSGPNTPAIAAPASPTTTITGLITGTYVFKWTVSSGLFCPSTSANITVNVTLNANAGGNQSYCDAVTAVNLSGTLASTGTWTQIGATPNTATITTTSGNTAIASKLIPGVYTFQYSISAPGCSTTDQMTVTLYTPPSTAAAGTDQTLCNAATFTMAATAPLSGTGTWSVLSGPSGYAGSFNNANSNTAVYTPTAGKYGVFIFQWTVSNSSCSNTDQVRVTNYAAPSPAIAGPAQDGTCSAIATMAATNPAFGLGTWTFVSQNGSGPIPTVTNPLLYNTTITGMGTNLNGTPDTYTFGWTVSNGICPSNFQDMSITVYQSPTTADAGSDQILCSQTSVLLAATPVAIGTGTWSQVSPAVTTESFSDAHSPTSTVNNIIPGTTYVFRWTTATASCSSTDDVTISNFTNPTTADVSGTITSYCTLVPIALTGNTPAYGTGTWTQTSGPALTILTPHNPTTTAIGGTSGSKYGFRWTISNGTCAPSSADVTVTLNNMPSQALAGPDQILCNPTTTATMTGNAIPSGETGLWSWVSGPVAYTITDPASPTTTITGLTPGIYVFAWSHVNGTCSTTDQMKITVYAATTTPNGGPNQVLCNANSITMAGNSPASAETGTWIRLSGPNNPTITSPNSPVTTITGIIPGTYVFQWSIVSGSCPIPTPASVTVTNAPTANAGPDQIGASTCGLTTVTLAGNNPAPGTGAWTILSGAGDIITTPNAYNSTFTGVAGNSYTLAWTISNGVTCSTSDNVSVTFNQSPTVNSVSNQTLCNGDNTTAVTFSGALPGAVYNWKNNNTTIGLPATSSGDIATFKATNTGSSPVIATITVTPSYTNSPGGTVCTWTPVSFTITVNPTPVVSSAATKSICTNSNVGYTITSATSGATFTWTASILTAPTGGTITGFTTSGSIPSINPILTNTGSSPGVVRYVITPTGPIPTSCPGKTFNFDVTAEPVATVTATPTSQIICSNTATSIALSTLTTGTVTYTWTASLTTGTATGFSGGNGSTIAQTLTNVTTSPATVTYHVTPSIGGCAGTPIDVVVTVDPSGEVDQPASQVVCNNALTTAVNFTTTTPIGTTSYSWSNNNTTIGLGSGGVGNIAAFTATNTGTAPVVATITVIPHLLNLGQTCDGPAKTFTITVNPTGEVNQPLNSVFCNSSTGTVTFATANTGGTTTYAWTNDNTAIGLSANGSGNISFTATNATTAPILANVVVTPTFTNGSTSCSGPAKSFTITINPSGQVNNPGNQELCNNHTTSLITFTTNNTVGTTTYSWTNNAPSIGLAASGSSSAIPAFTAINTGTTPVIATITVTPTYANGSTSCPGPAVSCTITVNPTPNVTSASTLTICSGTSTGNYIPTFNVAGTTYTWSAVNTVGTVTGFTPGGTGAINDILTNTGSGSGQVTYTIIPTGPTGCAGLPFQLVINVTNCTPKIGVAKQLVDMTNNGDGTFTALFNIRVENYGNVVLNNIQVTENLTTTFGAGNYAVLGLASTSFAVNTSYTGAGNLLDNSGTTNTLNIGASTDIRLTVKILSRGSYTNSVTASSTTGSVTDVSQNGSDPDPDGDGNPGNNSVVTPVVTACSPAMNVALSNASICYPTSTTYAPVPSVSGTPASYLWTTDGTGTFDHNNIANPVYTPSASDVQDGQVVLSLTALSGGVCPNASTSMILSIWTPPTVNVANATICAGSSYPLTGASATNFSSVSWTTSGTGTFNSTNSLNPTYTPGAADILAGSVTLTLSAFNKPLSGNACSPTSVSQTMTLTITAAPIVSAGSDATICATSSTYTLSGTASNYASLQWTSSGTGNFTGATTLGAVYTPSAADIATGQVQLTLTATGNGSCPVVHDFMVLNIWPAPTAYAGPNSAICSGNSFILSGATATNYSSITWSSAGGTFNNANALNPTFTPSTTGAITITLTANGLGGCSGAVSTTTLTVNPTPVLTTGTITNTTCNASVGAVTLTGSAAGTISLDGGTAQTSPHTFTGLAAGYHTANFTATTGGCTATTFFNITNTNSTLTGTVASLTNVLCNGGSTGTATITAAGGTAAYSFKLNGGTAQPTGVFTGLSAGSYTVLITDANTCSYTVSFTIAQPVPLTLGLASQTNVLCKGSATGSAIAVAAGGTTGYTYTIATQPSGGTATISGNVISGMKAGAYTIHVADANSCSQNLIVTITEPAAALDITTTAAVLTSPACNGASTGSINITVAGGILPYHFAWSNGFNGEDLINVPAGAYTVNVTDANGCTITGGTYTLTNPAAVTLAATAIVNTTCNASVGAVTLTGSAAGTISLDGGTAQTSPHTFTGLAAGYHTANFTATTGGCTATTFFNITNTNSTLTGTVASLTNVLCNGGSTGTATITAAGGTAAYSFKLNGGTAQPTGVFTGLSAGSYTVLITDANTCSYTVSFTIAQPVPLTLGLASQTNVLCKGSATGSAIAVAAGGTTGYTYTIATQPSGGTATISGNVISGMKAGAYTIHVADANSCSQNLIVTITEPAAALDITTTAAVLTSPACNGASTGSINITVAGGILPYHFAWSNGFNGEDLINVPAGAYTVNVTDANGCTITGGTYTLTNPAAVTLAATAIVNTTCNASVGAVTLTGSAAGTISLDGGTAQTSPHTFTGLAAGYHTANFTATTGGCTATTFFNITNTNSTLSATVSVNDPLCYGGTVTATVTATGGTGAYSFKLNGGSAQLNGVFNSLAAGSYNVLVTDGNGCTYYLAFQIDQPTPVVLSPASQTNVSCKGLSDGTVTVQATGGTAPYVYSLTLGSASLSGNVITGMKAGNYTIMAVDANLCSTTLNVTITETSCNPVTVNDNPVAPENTPAIGNVLSNDSDPNTPAQALSVTRFETGGVTYTVPTGGNNTTTIPGVGTLIMNSNGSYTFTPVANYYGPVPPVTYTASNGTNTNTAELTLTITPVNNAPVAGISSMTSQFNPGGTNSLAIPALQFSGTDADGTIASLVIPSMPINAMSITVGGTTYTSANFPVGGISVLTNTTGQPLLPISVDPTDGAVTSVLSYYVTDNNGLASVTTGSVSIPFNVLSVSGVIFNDPNGLTDNQINGTVTNEGGALYVNLVNSLNQVVASMAVAADGTYQFTESSGLAVNSSYKLILSNGVQTVGSTLSAATYPPGITSTGENIGTGPGSDGTIDGILAINTNSGNLASGNFGVTSAMVIRAGANAATCSSAGTYTLSGSSAVNSTSLLWTTNGTGSFSNATLLHPVYTPGAADISTGEVQLTLTGTGVGTIPSMTSQMTLTIWKAATANAGPNVSICSGSSFALTGANASNYSTISWTSSGGTFDNANVLNPTFTPTTTGAITITLTAAGLGSGTCSDAVSSMTLTVNQTPTLTASSIANTQCNATVGGVTLTGSGIGTISLDGGAAVASPHSYTALAAGYHTAIFTVTAGGCTASTAFNIINTNSTLTGTVGSLTNVLCNGGTTGSATITASGGTGTRTFVLNGTTTNTTGIFTGLSAGSYTVLITDANTCTFTVSFTVSQPTQLAAQISGSTNVTCFGAANGTASVNVTGGTTPYAYLWPATAGSQTTATATNLAPGSYTVTVTDKNGCLQTASITITEPAIALSASITASSNVLCFGSATGSATVTANNGTAPYSYLWSNGSTDQTATGLTAGTYSVIVTDKNGCSVSLANAVTITQPAGAITVNAGPDQTICSTTSTIFLTGTSAANALSYQWTTSGTGIFLNSTSLSSATYTPSAGDIATGQVQLILNAKGDGTCAVVSDLMVLNVWMPPTADAGPATSAICAGSTYILTGASATNYSALTWTSNAGGSFSNPNALNPTFTPATGFTGIVRLTLTAQKLGGSCSDAADFIDLTVNAAPTLTVSAVTNTTCSNSAGSVTLTGNVAGTVTLNGVSKLSPATFTGLAAGYFNATFTAAGTTACTATASFQISNTNSNLSGTLTIQNALCNSGTGSVIVNATGGTVSGGSVTTSDGYLYSLDGGISQAGSTISGITAGNHTIRITDDNGCGYSVDFYIHQPTRLILELSEKTDVRCFDSSTGSAIVNAAGGTTPYTYSVISGPNTPVVNGNIITGMVAGIYNVQVTDANNCAASLSVVINQPASSMDITAIPAVLTNPACFGSATGSINTTVTGGTPPYVYVWSNGTNSADPTGLAAGSYTVTVTDANNCSISGGPYVLTNPALVTLTASSIVTTTCGSSTGSVVLTSSDGSNVTLNGVTKPSGSIFTGLTSGSFIATSNGKCAATATFHINNTSSTLAATITSTTFPSCHNGTGSVVVTGTGGIGLLAYSLDGAAPQSSGSFFGISAGNHLVTISDANNCTYPVSFDIINPPSLTLALISQTNVACFGTATGSAIINGTGGTSGYSYSVVSGPNNPSITGNIINGMIAGTYNIQVEDASHCSAPLQIVITQPSASLNITATPAILVNPACYGSANGSINTTVTGGTAPYSYVWSNGMNIADPTGLAAGTYNVTVTDAKGCTIVGGPYTLANPAAVTLTASSIVNTTCDSPTGSAILTSSDGSSVTLNGVTKPSGSLFTGLMAGIYNPTTNGACPGVSTFSISNAASTLAATISSITLPACNNGTGLVTVSGTGGKGTLAYSLDGGATQATGIFTAVSVGNHVITVSDVNNCTLPVSFYISNPPLLTVYATGQAGSPCSGLSTGTITVSAPTGTGMTYSIDGKTYTNTTGIFTLVPAGTYAVTAKSQSGCISASTNVTINSNPPLLALKSAGVTTPISCNGGTATVTLVTTGGAVPVSYTFNGITNTTGVFDGVLAGKSFAYTITDANQCGPVTGTLDVTQPEIIVLAAAATNVTCKGAANGSARLTVSGGIAPYTYAWSGPGNFTSTVQNLTALSGGTYSVAVTDAHGCVKTITAIIHESVAPLSASAVTTPEIQTMSLDGSKTLSDAGGTITPTITGGTGPLTYSWTGPNSYISSSEYPMDLPAGAYKLTLSDAYGCTTTAAAVITVQVVLAEDVNCPIIVPNAFSPNGDGIHDYFKIACLYNYTNPIIEIYNRWGNLVYKKDHYGDTDFWGSEAAAWWNGRSENSMTIGNLTMPVGTYYYILKLTNSKVLTGFMFLNK